MTCGRTSGREFNDVITGIGGQLEGLVGGQVGRITDCSTKEDGVKWKTM